MASFRAKALLGVLVAVVALWAILSARDRRRATEAANAPRPPTVAERYRLEWPWKTESEWIVSDIAGALVNMGGQGTAAAAGSPVTPAGQPVLAHFDIVLGSRPPVPIDITDHIWAPATYAPFAATIVGPAGPPCEAPGEASLIEALLTPTAEVLQRENARISAALKDNMRCGGAHEQAALLVAAFALRESAGHFNDPRRLMSRMAAHLAFATALEGTSDRPARRLSEATLLTLAVRQQSALEALGRFETPTAAPALQAWARALRTRNTADWRPIEAVSRPSLLEMLAAIRATETSVGDDYTWKVMEQFGDMPNVPDVGRVLLVLSPGVFAGNRYAASNIVLETAEAAAARTTTPPSR
jgi:hypothetical protein